MKIISYANDSLNLLKKHYNKSKEGFRMEMRIDFYDKVPEALNQMLEMEKYTKKTAIDRKLRELIKIRASQINRCAHCLNMHARDARKMGETEQRIYCVNAFRDCDFYTDEEKAVLELTEYVTKISECGVPDEVYDNVRKYFNEKDFSDLIFIINQINSWNRLSVSMGNFATKE